MKDFKKEREDGKARWLFIEKLVREVSKKIFDNDGDDLEFTVEDYQFYSELVKQSQAWQPIETAPKDTEVILTTVGNNKVWLGKYFSKFTHEANEDYFDAEDLDFNEDMFFCPEGWYEYCGGYQGCDYEYESRINDTQPTHWKPMPEPILGETK